MLLAYWYVSVAVACLGHNFVWRCVHISMACGLLSILLHIYAVAQKPDFLDFQMTSKIAALHQYFLVYAVNRISELHI